MKKNLKKIFDKKKNAKLPKVTDRIEIMKPQYMPYKYPEIEVKIKSPGKEKIEYNNKKKKKNKIEIK